MQILREKFYSSQLLLSSCRDRVETVFLQMVPSSTTSFPDEDGDRLFIIIPMQAAWLGGMVNLVE